MYLVVGLGNPDKQYQSTFHNVGFMAVERFASKLDAKFDKGECRAVCAHARAGREKVVIAKPITYMNLSGESVRKLVNKYKTEREKCVIVYDDADLPLGTVRIRKSGSGGSHNGMKNVVERMGTEEIFRIRIGIGRPSVEKMELKDYVLGKLDGNQIEKLGPALDAAACAIEKFVFGADADEVMRGFNKRDKTKNAEETQQA